MNTVTEHNHTPSDQPSAEASAKVEDIYIPATMLFPYIALPNLQLQAWIDSLRLMAHGPMSWRRGFKTQTSRDGMIAINWNLALFNAMYCSVRPRGAVALVLLNEGVDALVNHGDLGYCKRALAQHHKIGLIPGMVQASGLYSFLQGGQGYKLWFSAIKTNARMKYGTDYVSISTSNASGPVVYKNPCDKGDIFLSEAAAIRAIGLTDTIRGKAATEHINNPELSHLRKG